MNSLEVKAAILGAKEQKKLKWTDIAKITGLSPEYVCSACLGINQLQKAQADAIAEGLGLDPEVSTVLQRIPTKTWTQLVPTDPLIYRLYEFLGVYGETIKEIVNEQFGGGIMSAIDFSLDISKQEDPKGDRVVMTLNGKFLPYKSW